MNSSNPQYSHPDYELLKLAEAIRCCIPSNVSAVVIANEVKNRHPEMSITAIYEAVSAGRLSRDDSSYYVCSLRDYELSLETAREILKGLGFPFFQANS